MMSEHHCALSNLKTRTLCSSTAMAASELLMRLYAKYAPTILRLLAPWSDLATQIAIRIDTTTTTLAASISTSATSARAVPTRSGTRTPVMVQCHHAKSDFQFRPVYPAEPDGLLY